MNRMKKRKLTSYKYVAMCIIRGHCRIIIEIEGDRKAETQQLACSIFQAICDVIHELYARQIEQEEEGNHG